MPISLWWAHVNQPQKPGRPFQVASRRLWRAWSQSARAWDWVIGARFDTVTPLLLQALQVAEQVVHISAAQLVRWHQCAGLDVLWIYDPAGKITYVVRHRSGGDCLPAGQMRKIGTESRTCDGPADGVTHHALAAHKHLLPALFLCGDWSRAWTQLAVLPRLKLRGRFRNQMKAHLCMLQPAELGALPAVVSRSVCAKPECSVVSRDQVVFACEVGNPEGVDHISRRRRDLDRHADGDVDLIRRNHGAVGFRVGVLHLPPPLVSDHGDCDVLLVSQRFTGDAACQHTRDQNKK